MEAEYSVLYKTKFSSQNFGNQLWFYTRLIMEIPSSEL